MAEMNKEFRADAYYTIAAKLSGKVMEAGRAEEPQDELVSLMAPDGSDRQLWKLQPDEDGCYKLIGKASGKALDIIAAGINDGAWVHQWDVLAHVGSQMWYIEPAGDGCYTIKAHFMHKCLDVVGLSQEAGARLQIWEDLGGDNQKWIIAEAKETKKPAAKSRTTSAKKSPAKPAAKAADAQAPKQGAKTAASKPAEKKTVKKEPAKKETAQKAPAAAAKKEATKKPASKPAAAAETKTASKTTKTAEKAKA